MAGDSTEIARISVSDIQTLADSIVKSKLFGLNNVHQAIALMALAQSEGIHPATAARDYHIIQGRPSMKAEVMLARFQAKGGVSEIVRYDDSGVTMKFSHPQGGSVTVTWDAKRAATAKSGGKDLYKTNPAAMYRSRCISEGIRTVFPGVIIGVYSPEEIVEFKPIKAGESADVIDAEFEPVTAQEATATEIQPQTKTERAKASAASSTSGATESVGTIAPVATPPATPSTPAAQADVGANLPTSPAPSPAPAESQAKTEIDTSDFVMQPPADPITAAQITEIKELKTQLYAGLLAEMDAANASGDAEKAKEFADAINQKWLAALAKRKVTTAKNLSRQQAAELIQSISGVVAKMNAAKKTSELNDWANQAVQRNLASGQQNPESATAATGKA